ncbi:MAG: nickel pincer cofactor biosynthesis protein LarC [Candidatus Nitrosotenuis sp.]
MVVIVDSQIAGISGDMLLSSLVHLGASKSKIVNAALTSQNYLPNSKIKKINFRQVNKHGIRATSLLLQLDEHHHERKASQLRTCIVKTVKKLGLSDDASQFAVNSIDTLILAESKIHGVPNDLVHFHEASSMDTVVDIVGCATALDDLGYFDQEIIATPVAVGGGTVTFSHGTVSNPAGAILEIFKKSDIAICGNASGEELTTPTGASMLVNLADRHSEFYPMIKVAKVGYGAGQKDFEGFSNVLKVVEGKSSEMGVDRVAILETNVDDVSGEALAHAVEKMMQHGAKDVTVIPTLTKKGRPGHAISVICDTSAVSSLAALLVSETGTLGVRVRSSDRFIISRQILTLQVKLRSKTFSVRCKMANNKFKVEYEDVKTISKQLGMPLRRTEELIKEEVKKQLR